jgi:hypothetical protein
MQKTLCGSDALTENDIAVTDKRVRYVNLHRCAGHGEIDRDLREHPRPSFPTPFYHRWSFTSFLRS